MDHKKLFDLNSQLKVSIQNGDLDYFKKLPLTSIHYIEAYHIAISYGHIHIVEYLLQYDFHRYNLKTVESLGNAIRNNHIGIIEYFMAMIKKDKENKPSIFKYSFFDKHLDVDLGQAKNLFDFILGEQLAIAASNGKLKLVKYFIRNGADIHYNNNYALYLAISRSHQHVIDYFVNLGSYLSCEQLNYLSTQLTDNLELFEQSIQQQNNFITYYDCLINYFNFTDLFLSLYSKYHQSYINRIKKSYFKIYYKNLLVRQNKQLLKMAVKSNQLDVIQLILKVNDYEPKYIHFLNRVNTYKNNELSYVLNSLTQFNTLNNELVINTTISKKINKL